MMKLQEVICDDGDIQHIVAMMSRLREHCLKDLKKIIQSYFIS
jgi:hypothetical protein